MLDLEVPGFVRAFLCPGSWQLNIHFYHCLSLPYDFYKFATERSALAAV